MILSDAERAKNYRRRQAVKEISDQLFGGEMSVTLERFFEVAEEAFDRETFDQLIDGCGAETDEYSEDRDEVYSEAFDEAYKAAFDEAYEEAYDEAYKEAYDEAYAEAFDEALAEGEDKEEAKETAKEAAEEAAKEAAEEAAKEAAEEAAEEPAREEAEEAVKEWEMSVENYQSTCVEYALEELVEAYREAHALH